MPKEPMVTMIWIGRPKRYGTRMLRAGDPFETTARNARAWEMLKKAKPPDRVVGEIAPPPKSVADRFKTFDPDGDGSPGGSTKPAPDPELPAVRAEYTEKLGRRPFPGWDVAELRRRMADAS